MKSNRILFIVGTRPEIIKVFPIIHQLKLQGHKNYKLASTGQHKDLLEQYWDLFELRPDYELDIMQEGQTLSSLTSRAILEIGKLVEELKSDFDPNLIIAQGDTTTVMASSMVAFYSNIRYAHVEAGLRSFDLSHPFPEEFNRRVSSIVGDYHFAPTSLSKENLLCEKIEDSKIHVVGNTVIDTLRYFIQSGKLSNHELDPRKFGEINQEIVLITCHRRENHDQIQNLIHSIQRLASDNPKTSFVWPVHPNPKVYGAVKNSSLVEMENVHITEPLEYLELIKIISLSRLVYTDSGGIQEEAPSFKVPVLVLRETTERPEAVMAGVSKLIGMDENLIVEGFSSFRPNFPEDFQNPYGDGKASERILKLINEVE